MEKQKEKFKKQKRKSWNYWSRNSQCSYIEMYISHRRWKCSKIQLLLSRQSRLPHGKKKAEKIANSNHRDVLALNKEIPFTSVDVISYNSPLAARLSQFEEKWGCRKDHLALRKQNCSSLSLESLVIRRQAEAAAADTHMPEGSRLEA